MAKEAFPNKIIWLASYPKSGNTWFRAFLTALLGDGEVEINNLKTDGIFSSRDIIERITDINSQYLYDEEVKLLQPDIFRQLAADNKQVMIIKVHDAFIRNAADQFIIPEDVTHCAIYLIRNPLDVVGSFANHNNSSIDTTITLMNNPKGYLARQKNNLNINPQTAQLMLDWSSHALSWTTRPGFPVYVLRYEDMLADTFNTFRNVLQKVGWTCDDEQIRKAINASSFDVLSIQEKNKGFHEKNAKSAVFFRGGKTGSWKKELTEEQSARIISRHYEVMKQYNYLP